MKAEQIPTSGQHQTLMKLHQATFLINLAALKQFQPAVYDIIKNYSPQQHQFTLVNNEANITASGKLFYPHTQDAAGNQLGPKQQAALQVKSFYHNPHYLSLKVDKQEQSADQFYFLHQFHLYRMQLHLQSTQQELDKQQLDTPKVADDPQAINTATPSKNSQFFSSFIALGVGLGYHLEQIVADVEIRHLIIREADVDIFYASLFTVDYHGLLTEFALHNKTINFFIGSTNDEFMKFFKTHFRNERMYNAACVYRYKHYNSPINNDLNEAINQLYYQIFNGLGFFEDELLGLRHWLRTIHTLQHTLQHTQPTQATRQNYTHNHFLLGQASQSQYQTPLIIIGSGPSIDASIAAAKALRGQAIIMSCSSSIDICYKHGITPDFHVEIERSAVVSQRLNNFADKKYLKKIHLLAVSSLHHGSIHLFASTTFGLKALDITERMYNSTGSQQMHTPQNAGSLFFCNPTSGNGALAFATQLGFVNIILFGLDFGMKDESYHHSKSSIYYDKNSPYKTAHIESSSTMPANFGGQCLITFLYDSARVSAESLLKMNPQVRCINVSDGVKINGAQPLQPSELASAECFTPAKQSKPQDLQSTLQSQRFIIQPDTLAKPLQEQWHKLIDQAQAITQQLLAFIPSPCTTKHELLNCLDRQSDYFQTMAPSNTALFVLLRGSFVQLQCSTSAYLLKITEGSEFEILAEQIFNVWRDYFRDMWALVEDSRKLGHDDLDTMSYIRAYTNNPADIAAQMH